MELSKLTIKEIKAELEDLELASISKELLAELAADNRKGVQRLAQRWQRKKEKAARLRQQFREMKEFERQIVPADYEVIGGVDEAGRGPLAGPVVAAVVILPEDIFLPGLNDSKQLSATQREEFFACLQKEAVDLGVGIVDAKRIDQINIRNATYQAMREAVDNLEQPPEFLIVDGERIPQLELAQEKVVDGDARSISIAAASIIAKVTRDRMLDEYAQEYPEYGFINHKGYGTAEHLSALEEHGPSPLHRYSFSKVREAALGDDYQLFAQSLKQAESIRELESIATSIKESVDLLTQFELQELRSIFSKRQGELK
ncbi:MAG: ribonuclease HII [Bacillota bacterium]